MDYDFGIIGGGPGGYFAAELAAHKGKRVILFEGGALGGTCLNEGCIPTKALLYSAKLLEGTLHGAVYGLQSSDAKLDHATVLRRKDQVVRRLGTGLGHTLKTSGVKLVRAYAQVLPKTEGGFIVKAQEQDYSVGALLLATGSTPALPPISGLAGGLESGFVITSKEALSLPEIPKRLLVIGAGAVGLELAAYYAQAGSAVTVIEALGQIGGQMEPELSGLLQEALQQKGIRFCLNTTVEALSRKEGVRLSGQEESGWLSADRVLLATGRRANVSGLEPLGLKIVQGAVETDLFMRTNVPGVFAVGDVNGRSMLAHTAYREAVTAVEQLCGRDYPMDYHAIPAVIYTSPEAAWVGESVQSACQKGLTVDSICLPMQYSGRFVAENEGKNGLCKLISDRENGRILGVHLLTTYASEIIYAASLMLEQEMTVEQLAYSIPPHPSVTEILREAALRLLWAKESHQVES